MENNSIVKQNSSENNQPFNVQRLVDSAYKKMLDLAQALSLCLEDQACKETIKELAVSIHGVLRGVAKPNFSEPALAILADVFNKFPDDNDCKTAVKQVVKNLTQGIKTRDRGQLMIEFDEHAVAKLAIAFSKRPDVSDFETVATLIAQLLDKKLLFQHLGMYHSALPRLGFDEPALANLADAFSQWPGNSDCKALVLRIAGIINTQLTEKIQSRSVHGPYGPYDCNEPALSDLSVVFSKFPDDSECKEAIRTIDSVLRPPTNLSQAMSQRLGVDDFSLAWDLPEDLSPVDERRVYLWGDELS